VLRRTRHAAPLPAQLTEAATKGDQRPFWWWKTTTGRAFSTDVLRELGYRILEAPKAHAGLEILDRQQNVRLLFTDIGLPGAMNGRQLSDEARQRRHGLKVLLTTGYAKDTIVHAGRLERGVALISKPFSFADLTKKRAKCWITKRDAADSVSQCHAFQIIHQEGA
jgi:CheY-like chemotaxis protein